MPTSQQSPDLFTKALGLTEFHNLFEILSVMNIHFNLRESTVKEADQHQDGNHKEVLELAAKPC